jgi:hypothetical protein
MSTANLAKQDNSLDDRLRYAEALSQASMLPPHFRGKPADVLLAMEWGAALGMAPMQAINSIHVINSKPGLSANALAALVRREGHRMRVTGDDKTATASIWRRDDPDFEYRVTWTMDMAKRAGLLTGKDNWDKYPGAMLKARAQTAVVRDACPELIIGLPGDDTDDGDDAPTWATPVQATAERITVDTATGEIFDAPADPQFLDLDAIGADIEHADMGGLRDAWTRHQSHPDWPEIAQMITARKAQLEASEGAEQ